MVQSRQEDTKIYWLVKCNTKAELLLRLQVSVLTHIAKKNNELMPIISLIAKLNLWQILISA